MSPRPRGRPLRGPEKDTTPINASIRASEVRLVDADGAQIGVISKEEAVKRAEEAGLDLVMVSQGTEGVPVCRILDYSKHRYQEQKRQRESKAKQAQSRQDTKVVQFRPKIAEHDYDFKKRNTIKFLQHGDRVQAQIFFRGREQQHPEIGFKILARLLEDVKEFGRPVSGSAPKQEGRTIILVLEPLQAKAKPAPASAAATPPPPSHAKPAHHPAPAAGAPLSAAALGLPPELADEIG